MDQRFIRNFSVIAHIDHGKSTLADRFLELTGALQPREMEAQVLDSMDLERERGITIKAHAVRLTYKADDGNEYVLNLIDTPGHVDFSYEVTRSLAACEGALLLVDASQGVEAQTLANAYLAVDNGLEIIPVINKIDLPGAQPDEAKRQIEEIVGLDASGAILASAKEGTGVHEILEAIVTRLPPPTGDPAAPLKALIFDSWYDPYRGVIILTRVIDGAIRAGMKIRLMAQGQEYIVDQVGVFSPKPVAADELGVGEVGFIFAGIKTVSDAKIGDTITEPAARRASRFRDSRKASRWSSPGFTRSKTIGLLSLNPGNGSFVGRLASVMVSPIFASLTVLMPATMNPTSPTPSSSTAIGFGENTPTWSTSYSCPCAIRRIFMPAPDRAVDDAREDDHAAIRVVPGIEDQRFQRRRRDRRSAAGAGATIASSISWTPMPFLALARIASSRRGRRCPQSAAAPRPAARPAGRSC